MDKPVAKTPKYAIVNGDEATFAELLPHTNGDTTIVVYTDASGKRFYATEDEWSRGGREFSTKAARQGIVTSESSTKDKIALFKLLFEGRKDVYAHGHRRKGGGIGYAPMCSNEWKPGVCPKKTNLKARCPDCPQRSFAPLSDSALVSHFKGERSDFKDVVGLYVLGKNCKTSVLVADFDKEGWKSEIAAYQQACEASSINVAIERSRSGNGGHAWIFFSEPIDAALARNLGSTLITTATNTTGALGFSAYDRLFPAQSTIPEGSFGNLIALPFQGLAQKQGNSTPST